MNRRTGILLVVVAALAGMVWLQQRKVVRLKEERDRHEQNSDALLSDLKRWQVDSATMATDVKTLRLSMDELERYRADDLAKIKQMGIKIKNLEAAAKHQIEVDAPIRATVRDSVVVRDSIAVRIQAVSMMNPFIQLHGVIERDSLVGSVHLPVTLRQAVWIEYKRRWLFWKKVKAVHQVITTDNPYVEVKYSEYINIQK
ncbi:hypothetical protein J8L13_18400 [Bacteroides fragilis]|jgi:hypothetical protein|uniref:DUF6549 family protein n=1 Tax=Bacteroides TaxID=816 RepID=UPI00202E8575|nr:DUF6549 family protein [Bacteroides fragilis]MCM0239353.1 hypothetical protein [Bacteroides fragilis]